MLLREFHLDAPNHSLNISSEFAYQTRCAAALFGRCFDKMHTESQWKILVQCIDVLSGKPPIDPLGVVDVEVVYDVDSFFSLSDFEKKKTTIELVMKGAEVASKFYNWPLEPFKDARNKVVACGYETNYILKKPKSSPNRKYRAEVFCEFQVSYFRATMIIRNKLGEIVHKKVIFETKPDELHFGWNLGKLSWESNDRVTLYAKRGEESWSVDI